MFIPFPKETHRYMISCSEPCPHSLVLYQLATSLILLRSILCNTKSKRSISATVNISINFGRQLDYICYYKQRGAIHLQCLVGDDVSKDNSMKLHCTIIVSALLETFDEPVCSGQKRTTMAVK